ncbi:MAG: MurR/RpiR family transcriptional regulator [Ostreibacterium sp.]
MPTKTNPPFDTPDEFFTAIDDRYENLSKRLQSIARELHFHRDSIALMNVNDLASAIDVAPSALVRFAQSMGFSGFSQMKNLFQQNLAEQLSDDNYAKRIQQLNKKQKKAVESVPGSHVVSEILENNIQSLQDLFNVKLIQALNHAVEYLDHANSIWVMAAGRSFSAAAYFTYLIRHSDKPIHWLDGLCFNLDGQVGAIGKEDVLLVISYAPYASPSIKAVEIARKKGAKIIAITDSRLNEIAKAADQIIEVREYSSFGFRSLANTVCIIQSLFLLYASHTELNKTEILK